MNRTFKFFKILRSEREVEHCRVFHQTGEYSRRNMEIVQTRKRTDKVWSAQKK